MRAQVRGAGPGPLRPLQPEPDTWCLRRPRAWVPAAPRPLQSPSRGPACEPSRAKGGGTKGPAWVGGAQRRRRGEGRTGSQRGSCLRTPDLRLGLPLQRPCSLSRRLFPEATRGGAGRRTAEARVPALEKRPRAGGSALHDPLLGQPGSRGAAGLGQASAWLS